MQSLKDLLVSMPAFPLMGVALNSRNTLPLDFSAKNADLKTIDLVDTHAFDAYVFGALEKNQKTYGIGGYFEKRAIYSRSTVFGSDTEELRYIHLGVDIWAGAGHPVFAPLPGKVHSFQNNTGFGNYGPTIILEHDLDGKQLYSLYGHLDSQDLKGLEIGMLIEKGKEFCHLGPFPENGDWPPHLHFQLMWDLMGNSGDFPGVCSAREMEAYQKNCPDPNLLIGFSE